VDPGIAFGFGLLVAIVIALALTLWRLPFVRHDAVQEFRDQLRREALLAAKEQLYLERESFENALAATGEELDEREERTRRREEAMDGRVERIEERERLLAEREARVKAEQAALEVRESEISRAQQRELRELERISGMRREEAEHLLLERVEEGCQQEAAEVRARVEAEVEVGLEVRARATLLRALRRIARPVAREALTTTVHLDEELKLGLVGREGRNARAFEAETGVDLLIDDTPGSVVLSAFEPVRREVAHRALKTLLDDGRIDPERIASTVAEARQHMSEAVIELGRAAAEEAGVTGLHQRLLVLVGRLEFHVSGGRSGRQTALEVAALSGTLAAELDLDEALARRCGLLHDVGRAVENDVDGSAAEVGAEFARRCGEDPRVVDAIASLRRRPEVGSHYAALVQLARRVIRARPGAIDERVDRAVARRAEIEAAALRHPGVKRAHAIQAGRQLRVIVDATTVSERGAAKLAREIAKELEQGEPLPGEVTISVLRETCTQETAAQ